MWAAAHLFGLVSFFRHKIVLLSDLALQPIRYGTKQHLDKRNGPWCIMAPPHQAGRGTALCGLVVELADVATIKEKILLRAVSRSVDMSAM